MSTIRGWIGVDLDGTLAKWGGDYNTDVHEIGEPVDLMVDRVKAWLKQGIEVRIVTARVARTNKQTDVCLDDELFAIHQERMVRDWCLKHIGQALPVTATKDFAMYQLWDDRAVQVQANTGRTLRIEDDSLWTP